MLPSVVITMSRNLVKEACELYHIPPAPEELDFDSWADFLAAKAKHEKTCDWQATARECWIERCRRDIGSYTARLAVAILGSQTRVSFIFHLWTFFIRSFRNPHVWNLPDHAILTVLNTSGFMAWKPSYGDAEVAGFLFTYSLE